MNAITMTADQILAVPVDRPEAIFTDAASFADEHKKLAKIWHTDISADPRAGDVMAHLNALKAVADRKAKENKWDTPGKLLLDFADGRRAVFRYARRIKFELGEMFYSRSKVGFMLESSFADLYENGRFHLDTLKFTDGRMSGDIKKYMPGRRDNNKLEDGRRFMLMDKTPDVFLLDDVRRVCGGKIDPKHVAWILSALYNIACYFRHIGLAHNGLSPSTIFISPQHHSALTLGGWWYAASVGDRMKAIPDYSRSVTPLDVLSKKVGDHRVDLLSIKAIGRELLGDRTGMTLQSAGVPAPMVSFLRLPSSNDAIADYAAWGKTLQDCFGPRRFTEMVVNENDVFNLEKGA